MEKGMDAAEQLKRLFFRTEFDHPLFSVDALSVVGSAVERGKGITSPKKRMIPNENNEKE